jgi:pimeloyl-ACP methyl ester carboxylesterase
MKKVVTKLVGHYLNTLHRIAPETSGAHGFRIFCYPFRPTLKSHQRAFLEAARHDRITVAGSEVQLYKWGIGKKNVLLMHGWQSHSFRWKAYVEAFPLDRFTIYAFDAPGHGLSSGSFLTVPLYSTVVERLSQQLGEIDTIVAHSLGAFTALYTLARLPLLQVNKLALLASPGEATEFIAFYQTTLGLSRNAVDAVRNHFEKVIGETFEYFSAPAFAATIRQPGLLIHDEHDKETPHTHSILINQAWNRSELLITNGLGHNLKSPEIVEKVLTFMETKAAEESTFPGRGQADIR